MSPEQEFRAAAWSWVRHLRAGGTTPWLEWLAGPGPRSDPGPAPDPGQAGELPGAAQLELLRRLAARAAGVPGGVAPDLAHLAGHALHRPGPGRGMAELPLLWPAEPALTSRGRAAAPADPAAVPPAELLRVGAGLLADLVLELPDLPSVGTDAGPPRRRRPARALRRVRSFRLEGPPLTVARLREGLAAAGLAEHRPRPSWLGGRRPPSRPDVVVLVAAPLEQMLFEVWSRRAQAGSPRQWWRFVDDWRGRRRLPPSAALTAVAGSWAAQVGPERVHVVATERLDDAADGAVADLVAEVVGAAVPAPFPRPRRAAGAVRPGQAPGTADLAPVLVDVLRRCNAVQNLRLPAAERPAYVDRLVAVLGDLDGVPGPAALGVPRRLRGWAATTGAEMARALRTGGYAVHGDLDLLGRVAGDRPGTLRAVDVLEALTEVVVRVDPLTRHRAVQPSATEVLQ